jgi:hypothetical protein
VRPERGQEGLDSGSKAKRHRIHQRGTSARDSQTILPQGLKGGQQHNLIKDFDPGNPGSRQAGHPGTEETIEEPRSKVPTNFVRKIIFGGANLGDFRWSREAQIDRCLPTAQRFLLSCPCVIIAGSGGRVLSRLGRRAREKTLHLLELVLQLLQHSSSVSELPRDICLYGSRYGLGRRLDALPCLAGINIAALRDEPLGDVLLVGDRCERLLTGLCEVLQNWCPKECVRPDLCTVDGQDRQSQVSLELQKVLNRVNLRGGGRLRELEVAQQLDDIIL